MAAGAGLQQQSGTQNRTTNANSQQRTARERHTFNISLPGEWGYQEFAALNWIASQISQISSQYLVGLRGFTMGTSSTLSTGSAAPPGETQERRGRRKMTPAQRAAHAERMRALAARRKQEKAAQGQTQQKPKGKAAGAGQG
jgi:hypothetical protein